jgi:hypothetical protein
MDITQETDLYKLKAIAYDLIAQKESIERDLNTVNSRIAQVINLHTQIEDVKEKLAENKKTK